MRAKVVGRDEWLEARRALLTEEKAFQAERDRLAERRRALSWVRVDDDYVFDGEDGPVSLAGLFGQMRQLVIYHFMYHPDWDEGCRSCSFWVDGFNGIVPHLAARDTAFACVSRAPIDKLVMYRKRMGWSVRWVSSLRNSFNDDYQVSFQTADIDSGKAVYNYRETARIGPEMPGISVFYRERDAEIFHTYSSYARGLDPFNPAYQLLDIVPNGRDEDALDNPTQWLRRRDEYEVAGQ